MPSFNKIFIAGNLTRDPELRFTANGAAVARSCLAINSAWKDAAGEAKEKVVFIDFVAWNKVAELLAQYKRKGDALLIEGRMDQEQWDDKQTGQKRSRLIVVALHIQFLGNKGDGEPRAYDGPPAAKVPVAAKAPKGGIPPLPPKRKFDNIFDAQDAPPPEEDDVPY